jgi:hypothetical protein
MAIAVAVEQDTAVQQDTIELEDCAAVTESGRETRLTGTYVVDERYEAQQAEPDVGVRYCPPGMRVFDPETGEMFDIFNEEADDDDRDYEWEWECRQDRGFGDYDGFEL